MNTNHPERDSSEQQRQDCMLYLFGELSDEGAASFERQLESSETLRELVAEQADLIASVSVAASEHGQTTLPPLEPTRYSFLLKTVGSLVAVATCIALLMPLIRSNMTTRQVAKTKGMPSEQASREELLIARAWAQNLSVGVDDDPASLADEGADDFEFELDRSLNDETLSWMYIAVSADSDALEIAPTLQDPTVIDPADTGVSGDG